jgi:hypothetical protein
VWTPCVTCLYLVKSVSHFLQTSDCWKSVHILYSMHLPRQGVHCLVLLFPSGQCSGETPEHHSRQDKGNKDETPREGSELCSEHRPHRWLSARPKRYTPPVAVHPCTGGVLQEKVPRAEGHVAKTYVTQVVVDVSCKRRQFCRLRVLMDTIGISDKLRRNL